VENGRPTTHQLTIDEYIRHLEDQRVHLETHIIDSAVPFDLDEVLARGPQIQYTTANGVELRGSPAAAIVSAFISMEDMIRDTRPGNAEYSRLADRPAGNRQRADQLFDEPARRALVRDSRVILTDDHEAQQQLEENPFAQRKDEDVVRELGSHFDTG